MPETAKRRWPPFVEEFIALAIRIRDDRLPQMAASLAYRTLLGLIPMLVVATVVVRGLMAEKFPEFVSSLIENLGLQGLDVVSGGEQVSVTEWVRSLIDKAGEVKLATLGWVGVGVVLFTAIWLVAGIEDSLNQIARSRLSRSWGRRILLYWFLLTAGPLILAVLPYLTTQIQGAAAVLPDWTWMLLLIRSAISVALLWLLLWVVYTVVPTTELRKRDLMLGAFAAAVFIELGRRFLTAYVMHLLTTRGSLYSSLGVAPIFMLWLYFMWLFVLLGVSLASHIDVRRRAAASAPATPAPVP
ncbi:MAG: YihY/virulence factor BrkB family protein [Phycisphaerae bacterium]|nr:YihY/virulence factor BrkB family protein [Phycisphaerae bacterium]